MSAGFGEIWKERGQRTTALQKAMDANTMTDAIMAGNSMLEKGRLAARVMANTLGKGFQALNEIRVPARLGGTDMGLERDPIMIRFDRSLPTLPVRLDPGVQEWLSEVTDQKVVTSGCRRGAGQASGHPGDSGT